MSSEPRTGRRGTVEADADSRLNRLTTGNRELDEILGGGIPANSINIIMGEPGSGKTTLAEEFIFANARRRRAAADSLPRRRSPSRSTR